MKSITNFIQLVSPQLVDQFSQISYTGKSQIRAIYIYMGYIKVTTKALLANIL